MLLVDDCLMWRDDSKKLAVVLELISENGTIRK